MSDRFSSADGEGEALEPGQLIAIDTNCRRLLAAAWPDADAWRLEAGVDVLRPYIARLAITGDYRYDEVRSVGLRLREVFYPEAEHPSGLQGW
ncbi:MAG TPA: hypothetical protein VHM23_11305 [Actinomycetota bacterium]|jgi:hypothetical protein|nr:hypothetical protein [Actinomycetota bacterium]